MLSLSLIQTCTFALAFVTCLVAVVLMGWKQCKQTTSTERSERLFMYTGCAMTFYTLANSFQWLPLWDNPIGHYSCVVIALLNLYSALSVLVMTCCIGAHLVIIVWQPRFIKVIKEVKLKIYKRLEVVYVLVTIALPSLLVPWPFINGRYGNAGGSCWIKSKEDGGSGPARDGIIEQVVLWYLWAFVLLVFTTVVVMVVMVTLCCATRTRGNANVYALFVYLVIFSITSLLGASIRIVGWAEIQIPYSVLLILTITIPLGVALRGVVFIIWVVCTSRKESFYQANRDDLTTCASEKSGLVPSETFFVPLHEDDEIKHS